MLVVDAHLDLAMNALQWNRDLLSSALTIRSRELGVAGKGRAKGTVALPEMRRGRVALAFATAVVRSSGRPVPHLDFPSPNQAYAVARGHLAYYRALEAQGHVRVITDADGLDRHLAQWRAWESSGAVDEPPPLGLVFSMECADAVLAADQLAQWWDAGLRIIGPAHFGPGRYAGGTGTELGLTEAGPGLLAEMQDLGFALDVSHLSDASFWAALQHFEGPVLASHNNCRSLVANARHLTDDMLLAVIERDGVIGATLGNWQLRQEWVVGASNDVTVTLNDLVDHIDHICQLAGNANHVGIGSDLDGGVGSDEFPDGIDTVADLPRIAVVLRARGYGESDISRILHGNWIDFLQRRWRRSGPWTS